MSQHSGLDRRAFLKNAGMTAVVGVVGTGPGMAALTAAGGPVSEPTNGKYDFDTVYSRIGTDCVKWDQQIRTYGKDSIAVGMGIADMDFRAAPAITRALVERVKHENWGYMDLPSSYADSIVNWNKRRYGIDINPERTPVDDDIVERERALFASSEAGQRRVEQRARLLDIGAGEHRSQLGLHVG